ncbi:MAG: hypothetical protein D6761_10810 [Candidatus Dadabacteria bacterium]|nr:MAG: hypothetical protein D6761_10810 [Candidatus Dadabacteria bacterium]
MNALAKWGLVVLTIAIFSEMVGANPQCTDCHLNRQWTTLKAIDPVTMPDAIGFDHNRQTGFPLDGAHRKVPCAACHQAGMRLRGSDLTCADCHRSPHKKIEQRDTCARCHTTVDWQPPAQPDAHKDAAFPLLGRHRTLACAACHRDDSKSPGMTPQRCAACHRDQVLASSVHPNHLASGFVQDCESCHTEAGWGMARVQHARFWPLRGAHRDVDCAACHTSADYRQVDRQCVSCHLTDYQQSTNPDHVAAGFGQDCESCHRNSGTWTVRNRSFHDPFFPISSGPHDASCQKCHQGVSYKDFTCFACHAHSRAKMDDKHDDVAGYTYSAPACLECHPRGTENRVDGRTGATRRGDD